MSKTNIIFSASSYDLFEKCLANYKYGQLMNLTVPVHEKSQSLDFGGLAHSGMEVYFKALAEGIHYNDRLHNSLMTIRAKASDIDNSNVDIETDLPIILSAVEQSCEYWRYEDENYLEILGVEEPFDYIMYEDDYVRIIFSGKIDLRVNKKGISSNEASYLNMPMDHKTYKRDFPVDRLNNQFINYCVPTESNYLVVNRIGLQKTLKAEDKFKRLPLSYDPIYKQQWKDNVIKNILTFYLPAFMNDTWPMRPTSCRKFGRLCEFHAVCDSSGEAARQFKLDSLFVQKERWDKYKDEEGIEG